LAELVINNKVHSATKVSLFMANYDRELRMGADIKRKGKVDQAIEFSERIKNVQKEVRVVLRKAQEEMKQQADRKERN